MDICSIPFEAELALFPCPGTTAGGVVAAAVVLFEPIAGTGAEVRDLQSDDFRCGERLQLHYKAG